MLIIGGGPAGMEAARVAVLRGHAVTLVEESRTLGGTALFAAIAYAPNAGLVSYLKQQLSTLKVVIELGERVDRAFLERFSPEVVVVATGARRDPLPIEGVSGNHVFSGDELRLMMTGNGSDSVKAGIKGKLRLWQRVAVMLAGVLGVTVRPALMRILSHYWMPVGRRVCIVGGGLVGVELAEFLAERGREVSIVEEGRLFGVELAIVRRWRVLDDLKRLGVVMINHATVQLIDRKSLRLSIGGEDVDIPADTVILANSATKDVSLADLSEEMGYETHVAGDCAGVGYIEGAIRSGHEVARIL